MSSAKRPRKLACVVLAAGHGTRMKSSCPKVLLHLFDRPMVQYSIEELLSLKPARIVIVTGKDQEPFRKALFLNRTVSLSIQNEQKGTAHALQAALGLLGNRFSGTVLVTTGDTPLLTSSTLRKFIALHRRTRRLVSVLSFSSSAPKGYGRVVRGANGQALHIVEEKDATVKEKAICEVNSGVYAIEAPALSYLGDIRINQKKKEYYLTDIVEIALKNGAPVGVYQMGDEEEFVGVNTRAELMEAHRILSLRTVKAHMDKGVSFIDINSVHIAPSVSIGAETVIYPNVFLHGITRIGQNCTIYPNVRIVDSTIHDRAIIKDGSVVESSSVGREAQVGPYAHIRPESIIGERAKVGNFVETKKSVIGRGSKAMHLSYIGDASLGSGVNVGAGTITCNYDGVHKHKTKIGDGVFIGSDTQLVAPVTVGKGAYIGAGSTITRNVPPGLLALSRTKQLHIKRKKNK
jgi:bifunctional UDP-N-acetylglucosamine pyrophosphorylase/glucosamine-1-phosphate N-acetyltransferase